MLRSLVTATTVFLAAAVLSAPIALAQNPPVRPTARVQPFDTMGPLSGQVVAGQSGVWTVRNADGAAVLVNRTGAGAIRYYATAWQGTLAAGRSATVTVLAKGGPGLSQAGLLFRLTNEEPRWVAFVEGADGKLALYIRRSTELVRSGTYEIPGGHLGNGDVLAINQIGDKAQLLANGYLIDEVTLGDGLKPNVDAPVGVITMGIGEFTLGNFGFGRAIVPAAKPTAAAPAPVAGNDDAVPAPRPPARPAASEVATLGPLGHGIKLGDNQGWAISVENGQFVLTHQAEDDLYYFNRSVPIEEASGSVATVTVDARGTSKSSGAGLLFGLSEDGKLFWALEATGDGKIKLFHLKDDEFVLVDTFDPPKSGTVHVLKMSKDDNGLSLYADDKLLTVVEADEPDGFDPSGRVGISTRGNGRFAFQDFAFSGPEPGAAAPPQVPSEPADVSSLGPLGHEVQLGDNSGWAASVQDGSLTYAHSGDDGGSFYRTTAWPGAADQGRGASLVVDVQGKGGDSSGGGLAFAVQDEGRNMLLWAACGDGKVRLFRVEDDAVTVVQAFTPATPGTQHALKVSLVAGRLALSIDGKTVKAMKEAELGGAEGSVGLGMLRGGQYSFHDFELSDQ